MASWFRYRRLLLILCVWGVAGSAYFFWHSLHGRHVLMPHTAASVPLKRESGSTFASGSIARPLQAATTNNSNSVTIQQTRSKSAGTTKSIPGSVVKLTADDHTTPFRNSSGFKTSQRHSSSSVAPTTKHDVTTSKMATVSPKLSTKHNNNASATTNSTSPQLLCVRFSGRLGNELFEYASTLGLALTLKRTPVFLNSHHLVSALKEFRVSPSDLPLSLLEQRCSRASLADEESCCKFKEQLTHLPPARDYRVSSYLQSYKYFHNHRRQIREALEFNAQIQTQAGKVVEELRAAHKTSTLVGVHVRHGDMATSYFQRVGYPLASPAYINRAMSFFSQLYGSCVFVVASDSLEWCRENFPPGHNNTFFLTGHEPAVDMLVLSSLDHVITSFGSFSWWIGYLSRGRVVYMKDFIRTNTIIGRSFYPGGRDYIYPGWIPL